MSNCRKTKFVLTNKDVNAIFKLEQKLLGLSEQFIDYSASLYQDGIGIPMSMKTFSAYFEKSFITRRFSTIDERMHHPH